MLLDFFVYNFVNIFVFSFCHESFAFTKFTPSSNESKTKQTKQTSNKKMGDAFDDLEKVLNENETNENETSESNKDEETENGIPSFMVDYEFPVDKDGLLKRPFRLYLNDCKAYDALYKCTNSKEIKAKLLKKYWREKYPDRDIREFQIDKLSAEDSTLHLQDEKFKRAHEEFMHHHKLAEKRKKYFNKMHPEDAARLDKKREEEKAEKAERKRIRLLKLQHEEEQKRLKSKHSKPNVEEDEDEMEEFEEDTKQKHKKKKKSLHDETDASDNDHREKKRSMTDSNKHVNSTMAFQKQANVIRQNLEVLINTVWNNFVEPAHD